MPYNQIVAELIMKFKFLDTQFRHSNKYSPIALIEGRVKSKSSIIDKAARKNIPLDEIGERMEDIAGIRIISLFTEDIEKIVALIRGRSDMSVMTERDYFNNTKPSGYRSYHIHIRYPLITLHETRNMIAEIQIRTMATNFWATVEHSLKYKYSDNLPEHLQARLRSAAEAAHNLDLEMSTIRGEIMEAQKIVSIREDLVNKINKNISDLYHVAKIDNVGELHKKFLDLYSEGDVEKLQDFHKHLSTLSDIYRAR